MRKIMICLGMAGAKPFTTGVKKLEGYMKLIFIVSALFL